MSHLSTRVNQDCFPLFTSQHFCLEQLLRKLGEIHIFSVCVKDIQTKKVCLSNALCEKFWGFSKGKMQGMTAREILTRVKAFKNVAHELANIENQEKLALLTNKQSIFQQILLSYEGVVQVRQSHIVPLKGLSNRLIVTVSLGIDLTAYIYPLRLLGLYHFYYPKPSEAVKRFSSYFQLDTYFYIPLSYEELRLLLTMIEDCRYKVIAKSLAISPKTVANYLAAIRDKLKPNFEIYKVVTQLRTRSQWFIDTERHEVM